jgi:hypothetical protein
MARSTVTRVKSLHDRMRHKPAAVMCRAVNTTWRNTGVTPSEYSTDSLASHASSRSETETVSSYGQKKDHRRNHHQGKTHNQTRPPLQRQTQKRRTAK